MAISINKMSEEQQNKIIAEYLAGKSMRQIEKEYGASRQTVATFLEKKNIKKDKGNHYRTYHHDENFFEIIDTEAKAYWLGFMYADGHITNYEGKYGQDQFGLSVAQEDKEILYKFLKDLKASNPVHEYPRKDGKGQNLCRVQLTSQKTVDDLIDKGCFKQKSLILSPPEKVPQELLHHFIRGFFDGDGSIAKYYNDNLNTFIYTVNFTSTQKMCNWLKEFFKFGSVFKEKRSEKTWYFSFGGHCQIQDFYEILYKDATIWMDRKYNRFQEFLKYRENGGKNV